MEFPLSDIYIAHWIKPTSRLCLNFKAKSCANDSVHHLFQIQNCIQFDALVTDNYETYNEYITSTNQHEHSLTNFMKLKYSWDMKLCQPIKLVFNEKFKKWVITDGVHRLSLLVYLGFFKDCIPMSLLDMKITDAEKLRISNALRETTKHTLYNGWNNKRCEFGYHSFNFLGFNIVAQRNNVMRISELKKFVSFYDKSVLDFGCNSGGILLHLPEIRKGHGFDYDSNCIAAANLIKSIANLHTDLKFDVGNLETLDLTSVAVKGEYDILFLCSLGSWIKNWKDVYNWAIKTIPCIIFEENNASEGASQLALFSENGCKITKIIENSPDDNTGNRLRNTYIIETGCLEKH